MAELLHQSVTIRNIIQHCNYDGIIMGSLPATKSWLVYMTSITTVYANCDYSIHGGCKPTYNWGSSTLYQEGQEDQVWNKSTPSTNINDDPSPWIQMH